MMKGLTRYNKKIVAEVLSGVSYNFQLLNALGSRPVIIDCGANIGSFSLACKTFLPDCQIIAVEPAEDLFAALQYNLACHDSVELIQAALSDCDGTTELKCGRNDGVANSIFTGEMVSESASTAVETRAMSGFLASIKKQYRSIDVLKMDTEGAEWFLLDTPDHLLAEISIIFMEFHSADFFLLLCNKLNPTHVIHDAKIRFPHRGEVAWLRRDLMSPEQKTYEIRPEAIFL